MRDRPYHHYCHEDEITPPPSQDEGKKSETFDVVRLPGRAKVFKHPTNNLRERVFELDT